MREIIFVVVAAFAFGTYTMPFSKIAKWNWSLPLMLLSGTLCYMLYKAVFEKISYAQPSPYTSTQFLSYCGLATFLYVVGFIGFEKLLSGPQEKVQLYVALCTALIPVFALLAQALVDKQMISLQQCIGLIGIIGGVLLLNNK